MRKIPPGQWNSTPLPLGPAHDRWIEAVDSGGTIHLLQWSDGYWRGFADVPWSGDLWRWETAEAQYAEAQVREALNRYADNWGLDDQLIDEFMTDLRGSE